MQKQKTVKSLKHSTNEVSVKRKKAVKTVTIDLSSADTEQGDTTLNSALHKLDEQMLDIISITKNNSALIAELAEQRLIFNNQRRQYRENGIAARSYIATSNQGNFFADNGDQKNIHSAPQCSLKYSLLCVAEEGCDGADDLSSLVTLYYKHHY